MQTATSQPKQRRLRDQLTARDSSAARFIGRADVANLMLLIDDDLRETAAAMNGIEGFLGEAQQVLDEPEMDPLALLRLCASDEVLDRMDTLAETLQILRRRLGALAATVK
jgi:hypothetical protein